MRCLRCGHENPAPQHLEPVVPKMALGSLDDSPMEPTPVYARWACDKCGRYHFPDGTLYSNPFATTQET